MMMLPIESKDHEMDAVILVLDRDNLERMKQADPAEAKLSESGKRLVNPLVLICYEEDTAALTRAIHTGDIKEIVKYLQRGWRYRPEKGDHDRGVEKLGDLN